jgi:hypothetical protein
VAVNGHTVAIGADRVARLEQVDHELFEADARHEGVLPGVPPRRSGNLSDVDRIGSVTIGR